MLALDDSRNRSRAQSLDLFKKGNAPTGNIHRNEATPGLQARATEALIG